MAQPGSTDTNFIVDLGNRYTFKRLQLNAFVCDNLFENFHADYNNLSFKYDLGDG